MNKRSLNFELLRVIAMVMIILLHYLSKGNVLKPFLQDLGIQNLLFWLIESFSIVAVNCYVLISGYFLADAEWKLSRIGRLLGQVLFYALLIPGGLLLSGIVSMSELSLYDWIAYLFPVGEESYWFVTAYILMYLFAPILAQGVKKLSRKQFQWILGMLLFLFSVEKTLIPVAVATDRYGYDFGWFFCLFLVAVYIRIYGVPILEKQKNAALLYAGSCAAIFAVSLGTALVVRAGFSGLQYYIDMPYCYNYFLCLSGAIGFFYLFKNASFSSGEGRLVGVIYRLAPVTLGVYLLHEHPLVRYRWPQWMQISAERNVLLILLHMLFCCVVLFACGVLAESVRTWLFRAMKKLCEKHIPCSDQMQKR